MARGSVDEMELSDQSKAIWERLRKLGVATPAINTPERGSPEYALLKPVVVKSKRGKLSPKTTAQRSLNGARRRMSPYQARALGSGRTVLPADDSLAKSEDPPWFRSPQEWIMEDGMPAAWGGHGKQTLTYGAGNFIHVDFPEWVPVR